MPKIEANGVGAANCIFISGHIFTFNYCPESRVALAQSPDTGSQAAFPSCHSREGGNPFCAAICDVNMDSRLRGNERLASGHNQLLQSFCSRASMMMPVFAMHMPVF